MTHEVTLLRCFEDNFEEDGNDDEDVDEDDVVPLLRLQDDPWGHSSQVVFKDNFEEDGNDDEDVTLLRWFLG